MSTTGITAVAELVERLDPRVAEIVRQDLIQSVGNALRYQRRLVEEAEQLDNFIQYEVAGAGAEWGAW
jgi:hypothetical protein